MTDELLIVAIILRCYAAERRYPGGLARRVRERCQAELRRMYQRRDCEYIVKNARPCDESGEGGRILDLGFEYAENQISAIQG
jgi:hypothetical protein